MEIWVIGSNVVIIALVGWLLKRSSAQEDKCNKHMIAIVRGLAKRPEFSETDKLIDKAIKEPEGRLALLREEFRAHRKEILGHHHEGNDAKVVLE